MQNEETENLGTNEEGKDDIVEDEYEASETEEELVEEVSDVEDQDPDL